MADSESTTGERTRVGEAPAPPFPRVYLRPGRDRRLRAGHPWAYANEVRMDQEARALPPGGVVSLHRVDGKPLGVGTFNPHALICFRLFSADAAAVIDREFLAVRLRAALSLRGRLFDEPFYRLVHGEADGLPGLVIDRFDDALVLQVTTQGMERLIPESLAALDSVLAPSTVVLRNDSPFRALEDLEAYVRVAKGEVKGPIEVHEGTFVFLADLLGGQKTGWYYDQRRNRAFLSRLSGGARVLDAYCYAGAFAVSAATAGAAEVLAVDSSGPALELARAAAALNGVGARCTFRKGDVFAELERLTDSGERFGVVNADPPAFVKSKKTLKAGLKGYRKLARCAARLVEAGGFLGLSSCSHNVDAAAFENEVATGIARAGRSGRIIRQAGAAPDHPVHPRLPESAYLKSLVLQLD